MSYGLVFCDIGAVRFESEDTVKASGRADPSIQRTASIILTLDVFLKTTVRDLKLLGSIDID